MNQYYFGWKDQEHSLELCFMYKNMSIYTMAFGISPYRETIAIDKKIK